MLKENKVLSISLFVTLLIAQCSTTQMKHLNANFFSQKLSQNLQIQYNDHMTRLRRSANVQSLPTTAGMKFKVGACAIEDFLENAQNCSRVFYSSVRNSESSRTDCGKEYTKLRKCMLATITNCIKDSRLATRLNEADEKEITRNFLVFLGDEKFWCDKGGLGIASDFLPSGSMCDPVFYQVSEGCTSTYSRLFNSTASDQKLCREYKKAKKCFLQTIFQHCSFSRMLFQMLEIMIEFTADFQPFCKITPEEERLKFEDLFLEKTCPPHSLADIAFALDVTNGTTRRQFISMKRMVGGLIKRMNYGWNGIHASVFQFDLQLRTAIKFGRSPTKLLIQRKIQAMRRTSTTSKNKIRRMTGRSLSSLARGTFSPNKDGDVLLKKTWKSGQRPHNTAVAFVLTTGPSSDSVIQSLQLLKDRNVHVVFVGPSALEIPTSSKKFNTVPNRLINTDFKFKQVKATVEEMVEEVCIADRQKQLEDGAILAEGQAQNSRWSSIQRLLERFGEYDLSLLFELNPIVAPTRTTTVAPVVDVSTPLTGINPFNPSEGGMDGDNYWENIPHIAESGKPLPTIDYPGKWPFDLTEQDLLNFY
ncbi:uncharacterized protein LOC120343502 [Styela clava]